MHQEHLKLGVCIKPKLILQLHDNEAETNNN